MASLAKCLDLAKIKTPESKLIKTKAKSLMSEGYTEKEANEKVIKDTIEDLNREWQDIVNQVEKITGKKFKTKGVIGAYPYKGEKYAADHVREQKRGKAKVEPLERRIEEKESKTVPTVKEKSATEKIPERKREPVDVSVQERRRKTSVKPVKKADKQSAPVGTKVPSGTAENMGVDPANVSGVLKRDYVIAHGDLERKRSWLGVAEDNLAAIETAKKIISENRPATLKEQSILAKYVGWGASELANNMFPGVSFRGKLSPQWAEQKWKPLVEQLQNILTPEEIIQAARSTQYAHYTSEQVIRSIYNVLEKFGVKHAKFLEPGMGVGNFIGLMPASFRKRSSFTGIERDLVTADIASLLYPNQNILKSDFIKQALPKDFFDIAIGNPPFSQTKILEDPEYKKYRLSTHNYFFAKALDRVRPGGLLVFVTSRYTMDSKNEAGRKYISERANLIGAIRLPQTAFKKNAGTEVVTDILFLQRKDEDIPAGQAWANIKEVKVDKDLAYNGINTAEINEYYIKHPEMVLGRHSCRGGIHAKDGYTVEQGTESIDKLFERAVKKLPENIYKPQIAKNKKKTEVTEILERDFNPKITHEGGIYLSEKNQLMLTEKGIGKPITGLSVKNTEFLKDYILLRDALKLSHKAQLENKDWEKALEDLNKQYDSFVKKHGRIKSYKLFTRKQKQPDGTVRKFTEKRYKNLSLLKKDVEYTRILTLEKETVDGELIKSEVLTRRTVNKPVTPEIKTVADALAVSLSQTGKLDIEHIADLVKEKDTAKIIKDLGDLIYKVPGTNNYILADEYLSGNVVRKLNEAIEAARIDSEFNRNVKALQKVQPKPLAPKDITVTLGATWIPLKYYNQFAAEVIELPGVKISYRTANNSWGIDGDFTAQSLRGRPGYTWSTEDRGANEILDAVLNNKTIKVKGKDPETNAVFVDKGATAAALDKAREMKTRFRTWIWEDSDRAKNLLDIYNTKINVLKGREFDGSHLLLPGFNETITPYDYQKNVIWRILQNGNVYIAHAVGAGKTLSMIAAGMELLRLGLSKKLLYTVPKHMLTQFAAEFQTFYPLANVLVADETTFAKENRRKFLAKAVYNDIDAIVMGHSTFKLLNIGEKAVAPVRDAFINDMRETLEIMREEKEAKFKIKQFEKSIEAAEQRFNSLISTKKDIVSFEELGVDFMFVDEAHEFRKLDFVTNRKMKGIDPHGSKGALGLYIKTLYLEKQNPGRSHVFASGTPIVNTIGELYTVQKFFGLEQLEEDGISHFDAWANMFGEAVTDIEITASGEFEQVERFANFVNVPEMMTRVKMYMDTLTSVQLGEYIKRPKIKGGKPELTLAKPDEVLLDYQKNVLQPRIKASRKWKPSRDEKGNPDPLINIITDGRLASIDMRYIDNTLPNNPQSKLNKYIDGIIKTYYETKDMEFASEYGGEDISPRKGGTQICFYNTGFGKAVKERRGFDSRSFLMQRLKDAGIPEKEVAWISDYSETQKAVLFKNIRQGKIRILLGSAKQMGTGLNIQNRLTDLHYLDAPWYPADVEQPEGRIIRQGNQNEEIRIHRYATEKGYDAAMWGMVARKSNAIDQALAGDENVRTIEDISKTSQYATASALASGDQRAIQLAKLNSEIEKLHLLKKAHSDEQTKLMVSNRNKTLELEGLKSRLKDFKKIEKTLPEHIGIEIDGVIEEKHFTVRKDFGSALLKKALKLAKEKNTEDIKIGSVSGIDIIFNGKNLYMYLEKDSFKIGYLNLKWSGIKNVMEADPAGLLRKITNIINNASETGQNLKTEIEEKEDDIVRIKKRLGIPFPHEKEYVDKVAKAATLRAELIEEQQKEQQPAVEETPEAFEISKEEKSGVSLSVEDIRQVFAKMKNVESGIDENGNVWFQFKGFKEFTILTVDSINNLVGLYDGKVRTGAFVPNKQQIWLKTGIEEGKPAADIGTVHHENWHLYKKMGVVSKADEWAIARALRKQGHTGTITEEHQAEFIANAIKNRLEQTGQIAKLVQKLIDFLDAVINLVHTTTRGVIRKAETGTIVKQKVMGKESEAISEAVSISSEPLFEMAGRKAFGAPLGKLSEAQKMLDEGVAPEEVWGKTGWLKTPANKNNTETWKWEIDDSKSKIKPAKQWYREALKHEARLENVIEHPELFAAYPMLKDIKLAVTGIKNAKAFYSHKNNLIGLGAWAKNVKSPNWKTLRASLLHEIQHAIQRIEGFAPGGSPKTIHVNSILTGDENIEQFGRMMDELLLKGKTMDSPEISAIMEERENYVDKILIKKYGKDYGKQIYKRLMGEIEARDAADRIGLTMQQRRDIMPYKLQGIPEDEWIVIDSQNGSSFEIKEQIQYETKPDNEDIIPQEDTFFQKSMDMIIGAWKKRGVKAEKEKKQLNWLEHHFGTTMFNAKHIGGAYERFYNEIRKLGTYKFQKQNELRQEGESSLFQTLIDLKKRSKKDYEILQKYLVQRDIDAIGYKVSFDSESKKFIVKNTQDEIIAAESNRDKAWLTAFQAEAAELTEWPDMAKHALIDFRKMTRNLFKHYIKGMEDIIKMAKMAGKPVPKVKTIKDGKIVKISLKTAMQKMGGRQGYYFPRIRESGEWRVEGKKSGVPSELKFFPTKLQAKQYMQSLERKGYAIEFTHKGLFSEDLYQTLAPLLAQEQMINSVMENMAKNEDFDSAFAEVFITQYANELKGHGSRSRMIGRSDATGIDVKRGYETDIIKAIAAATEAAAGGFAKQQIAINGLKTITGRDLSWPEFQENNPAKDYSDYLNVVRKRGMDAARQQKAYKEATSALEDILKNREFADNIIATAKGMAVVWYLGFRVSSAAVNVTNMAMAVPAVMNGELKVPFKVAFRHIINAGKDYGKYRLKKQISADKAAVFSEIEKKGYDAPQFNREALEAIQNKYAKAWNWLIEKSMWMFGVTERINRATTIFANYTALCEKTGKKLVDKNGNVHDDILTKAKDTSDLAHGVYGKEARPYHMRGEHIGARILQMTYVFQTFVHNYLQEMLRLGLVKKQYGAAAYMALSGGLFGGIGATIPMFILKIIFSMFGGDDPEEDIIQALGGSDLVRYGLPGLAGISLKGSLAINFDMPETTFDLLGAPGSVVADVYEGTKNLTQGFYQEGFEKIAPTAIGNLSRGLRESTEGVTTRNGKPVFWGSERLKGDTADMILRWLSFSPSGITEKREIQWHDYKIKSKYRERKALLYKRLRQFYMDSPNQRDPAVLAEIIADMNDFNEEIKAKNAEKLVPLITDRSRKQSLRLIGTEKGKHKSAIKHKNFSYRTHYEKLYSPKNPKEWRYKYAS